MNFAIKIDYTNILDNYEEVGRGQRGTAIKYNDDIIKIKNTTPKLQFKQIYSETNKYELTPHDNKKIENAIKLHNITNNLKHFLKVKGYIIFPNITSSFSNISVYNYMLSSYIYENVGDLTRTRQELSQDILSQLIEILTEFKNFNISGFFHGDIQGCNNIELDDKLIFHVIDLDDTIIYESNSLVKLNEVIVDLTKIVSCIESYILNKVVLHSDNNIQSDIETKITKIILELYYNKQLKFYNKDGEEEFIEINGLIFRKSDETYINSLHMNIINEININKQIDVNHSTNYDNLLSLIENYKTNKSSITDVLYSFNHELRKSITDVNIIYNLSLENLITNRHIRLKFEDVIKIVENMYDEKIQHYNELYESYYHHKYLKYKKKYVDLKNNNK